MKRKHDLPRPELPSRVPPWAAALASLLVPGLGQALARAVWRGILVLASLVAIAAMFVWRVQVVGYLQDAFPAQLAKTLQRQPGFTERAFHDRLLAYGSPPPKYLRHLLFGDSLW
jgi:hypothetical protein